MKENKTFADKAIQYFTGLRIPERVPDSLQLLNPYASEEVKNIVRRFYNKYYSDNRKRIFILGINPGRFGGGLTGISFTDPVALRIQCGIDNPFGNKKELSSEFIYKVIEEFGGPDAFFKLFFMSALYPLAILREGTNYNYYDDPVTYKYFEGIIKDSLKKQFSFGASKEFAICLGIKNFRYLSSINEENRIFKRILVLDHPRYIMQYKRKKLEEYIKKYIDALRTGLQDI